MSNEIDFLKFPLKNVNEEKVSNQQTEFASFREKRYAPCPGKHDNLVTISAGKRANKGLSRPKNVGTCSLHIAYYDKNGAFLGHHTLKSKEQANNLETPINTHVIKFGCSKNCSGTAILEIDVINIA